MPAEPNLPSVDPKLSYILSLGTSVVKHNFNDTRRVRKWLTLSSDCLTLKWRTIGDAETVGGAHAQSPATPRTPRGSLFTPRSSSSSILLSDVQQILYGPFSNNFHYKTAKLRVDKDYSCFSLLLRSGERSVDFAFEDDSVALTWLAGLQQLISFFCPDGPPDPRLCWTLPKLRVQRLRLKVAAEIEESEHHDAALVLAGIVKDATVGVYETKIVASHHVVVDVDGKGENEDQQVICQRV